MTLRKIIMLLSAICLMTGCARSAAWARIVSRRLTSEEVGERMADVLGSDREAGVYFKFGNTKGYYF